MKTELDQYLDHLRAVPLDVQLDQLEPTVWRRIESANRSPYFSGLWGWRAALAVVMLSAGVLADGAVTTKPSQEVSPFALHSSLAPSTLLEDRS